MYPTLRPALLLPLTALAVLGCRDLSDPSPMDRYPSGLAAASAPEAVIPLTSCMIITQPGTYRVVEDLRPCMGHGAVDIRADDVTVLLNGHILSGRGFETFYGPAIGGGGRNISILGPGLIEDFSMGMRLGGTHLLVSGVTIQHAPDFGIELRDVTDARITNNRFSQVNYAAIIGGGTDIVISGNEVTPSDPGENGFLLGGTGIVVRDNHLRGVGGAIVVSGTGNTIDHNELSGGGMIQMPPGSVGNLITRNRLDSLGQMLDPNGCEANTWVGNRFTHADPECLQ